MSVKKERTINKFLTNWNVSKMKRWILNERRNTKQNTAHNLDEHFFFHRSLNFFYIFFSFSQVEYCTAFNIMYICVVCCCWNFSSSLTCKLNYAHILHTHITLFYSYGSGLIITNSFIINLFFFSFSFSQLLKHYLFSI